MPIERTFSIIKPDATARNLTGAINAMIEQAGLRIVAQKRVRISRAEAETFYAVHRQRPFFGELVEFMTSAPVVVQVLEGDNAVAKYREIMGATDPAKAAPGTIRKVHARSIGENSVHGSDAPETAAQKAACPMSPMLAWSMAPHCAGFKACSIGPSLLLQDCGRHGKMPRQPTISLPEKNCAISFAAVSAASEPCTEFSPIDLASSLRMVPGAAFAGSVAPIRSR